MQSLSKESIEKRTFNNLLHRAERELGAFMSAVTELHGPQQARIAADDWICAFESTNEQFGFTTSEWRKVTIIAASRLATRLVQSAVTTPSHAM